MHTSCRLILFALVANVMEWKKSISLLIISYVAATFAQGPLDFTTSNNYQIINCNYPQPNSYASKLQSLLPNILFFLRETVLPDARSGNKGSSAFATFFTDNQSRAGVASIFSRIISARKVRSKRSGRLEKPRFGCLKENAESQLEREGYQHVCTGKQGGSMPAIHISDAEDVYLCSPEFFNFPLWPTTADCPTVEGGKLVPNDYRLSKNQMSILIHELAHLHGVNDRSGAAVEQYQVDDCAALRPMAKLKNAQNFALYAAGKSDPTLASRPGQSHTIS